ncbi:MAG: transposase [Candidatus Nitrosopolaris sp.]
MDVGKRNCKACIMSSDGSIAEETKYNNTLCEAEIFACSMVKKYGQYVAVCESTANLWLKTYQAFEKYSIGVKLSNPLKTKAIAEAKIKTDTLDARTLTHLLRITSTINLGLRNYPPSLRTIGDLGIMGFQAEPENIHSSVPFPSIHFLLAVLHYDVWH